MSLLPQSFINEIAKEVSKGYTCIVRKRKRMITALDPSLTEEELQERHGKVLTEYERRPDDYVKIVPPSETIQLQIMGDFRDQLADKSDHKQVANALKRNAPFRNFSQLMESNIELNAYWRNYATEAYQDYVADVIVEDYNY